MSYLQLIRRHSRFLAFGFALTLFSSFGQTFFIALFNEQVYDAFDLSAGSYGGLYSLATLASGLTIIWLGQKVDSVDLRLFTALLFSAFALAALSMALAPVVAVLAAAVFLLRLTGQGLLGHTSMTSMARYFDAARGKAMSIASLGFPVGEAIFPSVAVALIFAVGWRQTWAVIAAAIIGVVLPLAMWLLRGHADRHRAHLQRLSDQQQQRDADPRYASSRRPRQWTRGQVLRDARFYLMLPVVMTPGFVVTGIFFHQTHLVHSKGWSMQWFAACFAIFAAAQVPTGLLAGPLIDRCTARRLLPAFVLPLAAGLFALTSSDQPFIAAVFMILAGMTSGLNGPVVGSMWAEVYGVQHLGAIRAVATSIMVFGTAGSPVAMGWLIDAAVPMNTIAVTCGVLALVNAALAAIGLTLGRSR